LHGSNKGAFQRVASQPRALIAGALLETATALEVAANWLSRGYTKAPDARNVPSKNTRP
jgi:hypothetical protein